MLNLERKVSTLHLALYYKARCSKKQTLQVVVFVFATILKRPEEWPELPRFTSVGGAFVSRSAHGSASKQTAAVKEDFYEPSLVSTVTAVLD